ncbi:helix-loop-helix dna-binding domain-containing protein [Ophiostoma piceae UAMH 11346]|uniref:Helix-loop-helix dna-binding domain-containing protein n=1 Tax=Ophiostoma piceae (strain UAMH 11346) TaxID=1262450 RepID=S3BXP1_OPHP1|nr:helix-loop-helix dna-binding domain-containing protein [Ophiostoma piceae UAMH 11346]
MSTVQQKSEELSLDDTALEKALSDEGEESFSYSSLNLADQLSGIDSMPPADIPQREGLYSTPLSWERPQMGMRLDSMLGLPSSSLSEAEQRRLIAIAMNSGSTTSSVGNSMNNFGGFPMFGPGMGTVSLSQITNNDFMSAMSGSSETAMPQASRTDKQSKDKGKEKPKSADRTAHNDIERKYRTNLKDKIAELRDAVPALRTIPENSVDDGDGDGEGSVHGSRGPKVSKGTVLTKATDYIHQLEKKQQAIMRQHQELSRRLQAFEQLLNAAARPTFQMPNYSRALFDPRAFC